MGLPLRRGDLTCRVVISANDRPGGISPGAVQAQGVAHGCRGQYHAEIHIRSRVPLEFATTRLLRLTQGETAGDRSHRMEGTTPLTGCRSQEHAGPDHRGRARACTATRDRLACQRCTPEGHQAQSTPSRPDASRCFHMGETSAAYLARAEQRRRWDRDATEVAAPGPLFRRQLHDGVLGDPVQSGSSSPKGREINPGQGSRICIRS
jgi:hypothetical protein